MVASPYSHTLSKSDFKLGRTCPTKLYYREHGYPDNGADSPMLQMLADGGYKVEALAKALHGTGIALPTGGDPAEAHALTREHLQADSVTLFEATILVGRRMARVDILEKEGNRVRLIEVKSTSFNSVKHAQQAGGCFRDSRSLDKFIKDWVPYLEDITYQTLVVRSAFPAFTVTPYLLLVDTAKRTGAGYVPLDIDLDYKSRADGTRRLEGARYVGDPALLVEADILTRVDVTGEVEELSAEVADVAAALEEIVVGCDTNAPRPVTPLGTKCKQCEFRVSAEARKSGFEECWGDMANATPHVLDLYRGGQAIGPGGRPLADEMALQGKGSLLEISEGWFLKAPNPGKFDHRRSIQVTHSRARTCWVSPALKGVMDAVTYPAHFIDFETSAPAIPYHPRMAPYEMVAFQFSCHTVAAPGAEPLHCGWLNVERHRPDTAFANALRGAIGDFGGILTWAPHERTTLVGLAGRLIEGDVAEQELAKWLQGVISANRILDLNAITRDNFFHPDMGGRTSIKVVLDALWKSDGAMRQQLASWTGQPKATGQSPYSALPPLAIGEIDEVVQEGTGAVLAYEDMLYGRGMNDVEARDNLRNLLLQYCALDTMAMVLIWEYWRRAVQA